MTPCPQRPRRTAPTRGMTNQKLPNASPTVLAGSVAIRIAKLALHSPATIPTTPTSGRRRSRDQHRDRDDRDGPRDGKPAGDRQLAPAERGHDRPRPGRQDREEAAETQREDAEPHSRAHATSKLIE